jgi:hypothetical protein
MRLNIEAIKEYQKLHEMEFGEKLTDEEAEVQAYKVLSLFKHIFNHNSKC